MTQKKQIQKAQKAARVGGERLGERPRTAASDTDKPSAIFEMTETTYVDVIWFCAWEDTDWMAVLSKPTADGAWTLVYRFRYYQGEAVWDSEDRKSVYELKTDASEANRAKIELTTDAIAESLARANAPHSRSSKLIVRGDSERALELLSVQDWAHKKIVPVTP